MHHGLVWRTTSDGEAALARPPERARARGAARFGCGARTTVRSPRSSSASGERFGMAVFLAAHSMPSVERSGRGRDDGRPARPRADVVPGTRGRKSAAGRFIDAVEGHALAARLDGAPRRPVRRAGSRRSTTAAPRKGSTSYRSSSRGASTWTRSRCAPGRASTAVRDLVPPARRQAGGRGDEHPERSPRRGRPSRKALTGGPSSVTLRSLPQGPMPWPRATSRASASSRRTTSRTRTSRPTAGRTSTSSAAASGCPSCKRFVTLNLTTRDIRTIDKLGVTEYARRHGVNLAHL